MKKLLFLLSVLCSSPALSQVKQSGTVTPGHAVQWTMNGTIQDAGPATRGTLTSLGITASGPSFCINSDLVTSAGWQQFCFGVTTAGGGTISVQNFGTAPAKPFTVTVNGTPYQFPFTTSGILGPVSTTIGHLATWNNTTGTLLADGGAVLIPGGSSGQVQINQSGVFGGITNTALTALINTATASLPGSIPAWPNNTTTFFRGDGTYSTLPTATTGALGVVRPDGTSITIAGGVISSVPVGGAPTNPAMRLTLVSGVPVPTTDQSGIASHYCTPYPGGSAAATAFVPITTDGINFTMTSVGELTQTTTDATKSPAAVANNSVYDVFLWSDAGTIRCTRGPAWSSDTSRGTGAGTSEIDFTTVFPTNKNAITNGPAANRGVLFGSERSNGSAVLMDSALFRWVSNVYNAVPRKVALVLTGSSGGYGTASWRQWDGNSSAQVDILQTLAGIPLQLSALGEATNTSTNAFCPVAIGIDSATLPSGYWASNQLVTIGATQNTSANYADYAGLGRHFAAMLEYASTGTCTQVGASAVIQSGLFGTVQN